MGADEVGCAVAVKDGHLDVHEDYVGFGFAGRRGCYEVIESFPTVPNSTDREAIFLYCFEGNLLVDGATDS